MSTETTDAERRDPPKEKITFEEFLDWCDEDTWAEWVDGEVIMASPASKPHQRLGSFLEKVLGIYVEPLGLGEVFRAPFVMRIAELSCGCEPDLLFVQRDRAGLVKHTYMDGAADMVVESSS